MSTDGSVAEIQRALAAAQERRARAMQARDFEQFGAAQAALLSAERALAAALNEPHAMPIEFPVQWDGGAPLPHLLQNDNRSFLAFVLADAERPNSLGIVEFKRCICTKMGTPNDEAFHGHPLNGKGLQLYRALEVKNSPWIRELEAINSVHRAYKP